ncbi:uncharacterized protein KY384_007938 [Bacidia gigantensis]|uniref:uncharacterized protein n=1 Tax=Bacidia gigantensis TaxID=2732470 RepID=UPI001D04FABF|nr:uncharacterized protein KY384_007938 [Bacidia gigantensis]KAG8527784.1 hypothetical protein KY384_007938 [Bacidia gigantensis]
MANVRPSTVRSQSYYRPSAPEKDSLRPRKEEKRSRSTSRNPSSKLYSADAPRRYAPNESRPRKPPFSPTIEDLGFGPDCVQMKGKLDQTPMLIKVDGDSSSTDGSEPGTPDSSLSDGQDSYISGSDRNTAQISKADEVTKTKPKSPSEVKRPVTKSRRSRQTLTVDTERARSRSRGDGPPPNLKRERSPYSYQPPPAFKPNDQQDCKTQGTASRPGDYQRSPGTLTSTASPVRRSFEPPSVHACSKDVQAGGGKDSGSANASGRLSRPQRPGMERRASAMPQLGSPTSATAARSRYVENSSDESDREYARIRARSGQLTADALPINPPTYFDTPRYSERHANMKNRDSPPQTPLSPEHTRGTFLNRDHLVNGTGLQHLSTLLEDQQSSHRSASPRPSPQPSPRGSPTGSPGPSPPRTPPESYPRHHRRTSTAESLSKYLTNSRISSPLSSRPSTPTSGAKTFTPRPMEHDAPQQMTKERRVSTFDSSDLAKQATGGAKADARPSSPTVSRHESYEHRDPKYERGPQVPYHSSSSQGRATLEPARPERRPSREDMRKALPSISTKPVIHQELSDPKAAAPRNRSGSYVPASATAALGGASFLDPNSSTHRSRSNAPDAGRHRHRSRSRSYGDAREATRSQSAAPVHAVPASDQRQPVLLPQCPRAEPVAGFDDWLVLERDTAMTICPECRHNVFGRGFERAFRRGPEVKRNQKVYCNMNDPWVRLACLDIFKRQSDTKTLGYLMEYTKEEPPCPEHRLVVDHAWYHLRDSETNRDFQDFQVCSNCVYSLEAIYPRLDIFHRSKDIKQEQRGCSLRSDVVRFGKYLNFLVSMADEEEKTRRIPSTSDFIWEVKWQTVISPCKGSAVYYGQDMHTHPEIPGLTICEECYYKDVRPLAKLARRDSRHFVLRITQEAKEIVGGTTCKLYSPRMKQIFKKACEEREFEQLAKAVKKRNELQQDLEESKMEYAKRPLDTKLKEDVKYLQSKWEKLERKHNYEHD